MEYYSAVKKIFFSNKEIELEEFIQIEVNQTQKTNRIFMCLSSLQSM